MQVFKNESSETWHLVGSRGCGANPDGESVEDTWAMIRDSVDRDDGSRCARCNWPTGR